MQGSNFFKKFISPLIASFIVFQHFNPYRILICHPYIGYCMADDDIKRKVLTDATNIARTIVKEIDSIKADGVPKDINRKLTTIQTKTKELLTEIRDRVLQQTKLGDF